MNKCQQLMEYTTQDIVSFIIEDAKVPMEEAMDQFYTSQTYGKLIDEDTMLYLESSASVYDIFKTEQNQGKLLQTEFNYIKILIEIL
ncbi:MAG: hypothetical protein K0R92_3102 [Lachnospiraceae bacterium]|jgi:hypothetical protein|nr:hypothetical protein [Lachnospiraceae bacterium]